jgi:hypothetical protein
MPEAAAAVLQRLEELLPQLQVGPAETGKRHLLR